MCNALGIGDEQFYEAISSFKGAAKRLELIAKNEHTIVYKDFAHSPSKLKATVKAVKEQYPDKQLVACMELHTFSSLNTTFLQEYQHTMIDADMAYVYYNEATVQHKKLAPISKDDVGAAFGSENVIVYNDSDQLFSMLKAMDWKNKVLLLMSSGNFSGVDLNAFGSELID